MKSQAMFFKARAGNKLADEPLQATLQQASQRFVSARASAVSRYELESGGDFEALRSAGQAIRDRVLADLDVWLEEFEKKATETGATVLYAESGRDICELVVDIAKQHGVRKVVKSKSMLSEEAALNAALEAAGIVPVETDLGEYIQQIDNNEPPSHILAPAFHKSREEVSALFARTHGRPRKTEIPEMTREAREVLREHFLTADMGISGGNFLVTETGSVALVTNEGNGRMVTTLPRVHVVITGIEKLVPTLEDLATLLRLLPRSGTGQDISNYVSVLTGVRGEHESDGPEHLYFILVDNGRAAVLGSEYQPMLRCIRCGACMNHCPVYQSVGGHAYGWVYPGPMGAVLTSLYTGLENAAPLAHASTLCKQCETVCPVRIPLPALLRGLREEQRVRRILPLRERLALRMWAWVARHPRGYRLVSRLINRYLTWLAGDLDRIPLLGAAPEWSRTRDLPAPRGQTFSELYARRRQSEKH